MTTVLDPELVAPAADVQALLDGERRVDDPALDAALTAARDPDFRIWTEGIAPAATALGNSEVCVLVTDRPGGRKALLPIATGQLAVALAVWLRLGPRPVPDHPPVRLDPGSMAILIGRRQAHGHGLDPDLARVLQRRLDAGFRHWTVAVERAGRRRNLEVLEGDGGIWRVRPVEGLVELAPTSTTAVVRELVALVSARRRPDRSAAP